MAEGSPAGPTASIAATAAGGCALSTDAASASGQRWATSVGLALSAPLGAVSGFPPLVNSFAEAADWVDADLVKRKAMRRPGLGKGPDCGRQMHTWHIPIRKGQRTYCSICGKLRRRSKLKY